ncbi:MAG: aldo/keto reductase [Clostridiales bacterium]|nr:aldo/keto reductase [Clostridiales bacterium]
MEYIRLPGTGLQVSRLSLGTMTFGGQTNERDSLAILDHALDQGVNFWDTANMYTAGTSETIVGKALKGRRERVILATKVFNPMSEDMNDWGLSRRAILSAVDKSLKRLDTDWIDLYYLHSPDYHTDLHETLHTMDGLVKAGKIRYIGVSNFAAWQVADMLGICGKEGFIKPIYSQNMFNLITRAAQTEMLPFLRAHNMGMAVYNPIAAGLLTGKHRWGDPAGDTRFALNPNYFKRYWLKENFDAVDKLDVIARERGISLLSLSLKWLLAQPGVHTIISGVSRQSQLEQNIKALDGDPLDEAALAACDAVWAGLTVGSRAPYNR